MMNRLTQVMLAAMLSNVTAVQTQSFRQRKGSGSKSAALASSDALSMQTGGQRGPASDNMMSVVVHESGGGGRENIDGPYEWVDPQLKQNSRNFRVNREMREKNCVYNPISNKF